MDRARLDELERFLAEATPRRLLRESDNLTEAARCNDQVRMSTNSAHLLADDLRQAAAIITDLPDLLAAARNWQRVVEQDDAIVERVARAIMVSVRGLNSVTRTGAGWRAWEPDARAALAAITESDDGILAD